MGQRGGGEDSGGAQTGPDWFQLQESSLPWGPVKNYDNNSHSTFTAHPVRKVILVLLKYATYVYRLIIGQA